jgi:hypothetical protein
MLRVMTPDARARPGLGDAGLATLCKGLPAGGWARGPLLWWAIFGCQRVVGLVIQLPAGNWGGWTATADPGPAAALLGAHPSLSESNNRDHAWAPERPGPGCQ